MSRFAANRDWLGFSNWPYGVPLNHISLAAPYTLRVCRPVQQMMAKFVSQVEVDPAYRGNAIVVDDAPSCLARGGAIERAVKPWQPGA